MSRFFKVTHIFHIFFCKIMQGDVLQSNQIMYHKSIFQKNKDMILLKEKGTEKKNGTKKWSMEAWTPYLQKRFISLQQAVGGRAKSMQLWYLHHMCPRANFLQKGKKDKQINNKKQNQVKPFLSITKRNKSLWCPNMAGTNALNIAQTRVLQIKSKVQYVALLKYSVIIDKSPQHNWNVLVVVTTRLQVRFLLP